MINPYESPRQPDDYLIIIWLKRKWQMIKDLALELGRLGIVMGVCLSFGAVMAFTERSPFRSFLIRLGLGIAVVGVGLLVSYLIYAPARSRLRDLESRLPSATQVLEESDPDADDDEHDPDGTTYLERSK